MTSFDEGSFWNKLSEFALSAGKEVVEKALCLYYAAQKPEMPHSARLTVFASLAYFILPTDAVPDLTPLIGYTDDLGALTLALTTIATYVDDDVKIKARTRLQEWFDSNPKKDK